MENNNIDFKLKQLKGLIAELNGSIVSLISKSADVEMKLRKCGSTKELTLIENEITELLTKYSNYKEQTK